MRSLSRYPLQRLAPQGGFSLIEIMVGLVVGLLGILMVMQIFLNSEGSKRTTTGGNDAQINGTIALYGLERDLRSAGHGISAYALLGCGLTFTPRDESTAVTLILAPATINPAAGIVPAGDANTDTLLVISGNSEGPSEGDLLTNISTSNTYVVATPSAFSVNDNLVLQAATRPASCNLTLSKVTAKSGSSLTIDSGVSGMPVGGQVYNLGKSPAIQAYAIRNGNLTVCDYTVNDCGSSTYASPLDSTVWVPVASNIVSLRAQYGRDTTNTATSAMDGVIDTFDQTTPASASDTSGLPAFCSWSRVLSTRLAVVARSSAYDKTAPTTATLTWAGSAVSTNTPTNPTAVTLDLTSTAMSGNISQWQNYRYKTVQTLVPARNTIWQGSQAGWEGGAGGC